ncbi:MAG: glycoside hydrolase family 3 protein [Campylobacterales bacterium]
MIRFVSLFLAAALTLWAAPRPSLEKMIGQMVMVGFHGTRAGEAWPKQLRAQIKAGQVGGVVLYAYNVKDPMQLSDLTRLLHYSAVGLPLWMAVDQEGGQIQRLTAKKGFSDYPAAKDLAAKNQKTAAAAHYRNLACELRGYGFNFNFGPVVDLEINASSPAIGKLKRSYGPDAKTVTDFAEIFIKAHQGCGIATSLKHFPGHGSANGDTHEGLVDVTDTFSEAELEPFKTLIGKKLADSVMVAHVIDRAIDDRPAALSKKQIDRIREMGFDGVVISDDLQMGAIREHYDFNETVLMAVEAGNDLLLFSNYFTPDPEIPVKVQAVLKAAVESGRIDRARIEASYRRIAALKNRR